MTREEAIQFIDNMKHEEAGRAIGSDGFFAELMGYHVEALQMAIEALQTEPCEDCISRQAVNDLVDELARSISDERCCISIGRSTATIMQDILNLPSVQPEQKTGHWSHDGSHWKNRFICSECEYKLFDEPTNYCPNCGCRMEEGE